MPAQIQRGISLIVLPLPSERAGERLFPLIPSSQVQRGISLIVLPLPSERVGERLLRGYVQAFEIPLQFILHHYSQINSLSLKTVFVTSAVSIGYK